MPKLRRLSWELFFYLHQIVILCLLVLFVFHSSNFVYYATIPFVLYGADKLLRWISIYSKRCYIRKIEAFDDLLFLDIEVNHLFKHPTNYPDLVGSVAYIRIPRAKWFEYHPMSLAYNDGNHLYFYIKVVGNPRSWTHRLAALAGQTDLRAFIEGPYTMTHRHSPLVDPSLTVSREYGENVLVVAGGAGFAGVSTYLRDYLRLVSALPAEDQEKKRLFVVLVVPHPAQLQCMAKLLLQAKRAAFCRVELFVTFSRDAERRQRALQAKERESCSVKDAESAATLEFSVGRPEFESLLKEIPSSRLEVYYCGPRTLEDALFKALVDRKSPFAFHPEVFDM